MVVGLAAALPCVLLPLVLPNKVRLLVDYCHSQTQAAASHSQRSAHHTSRQHKRARRDCCEHCGSDALAVAARKPRRPRSEYHFMRLTVAQADEGKPWYEWFWVKVGGRATCRCLCRQEWPLLCPPPSGLHASRACRRCSHTLSRPHRIPTPRTGQPLDLCVWLHRQLLLDALLLQLAGSGLHVPQLQAQPGAAQPQSDASGWVKG